MAGTYKLQDVFQDVAYIVKASGDTSSTTICTHINDMLDGWDKAGFKVNHDYNQDRAVKIVRKLAKTV
mgnify:CR=1 FL=1